MDADLKADARAKWKQSQRYKRHKDGPKGGVAGGRGGHQRPRPTLQLPGQSETAGRLYDEFEEGASPGEMRPKSRGLDLAELLSQTRSYDPNFYHKLRFDLIEEYGMPPPVQGGDNTRQDITFDLEALAACLSKLPLQQVLNIDGAVELAGSAAANEPVHEPEIPTLSTEAAVAVMAEKSTRKPQIQPPKLEQKPVNVAGENINKVEKPAVTSIGGGDIDDNDEELDFLLGLAAPSKPAATGAAPLAQSEQQTAAVVRHENEQQSLEDWLDNL